MGFYLQVKSLFSSNILTESMQLKYEDLKSPELEKFFELNSFLVIGMDCCNKVLGFGNEDELEVDG